MLKSISRIISLFLLCLLLASWGAVGHKIINSKSTDSFPGSMKAFVIWSDSLGINASNADNRKNTDTSEGQKHFIDIDSYPEFNSTGRIASTYDSIVNLHTSSYVINIGILPWATVNMYDTLVVDFKMLKWHKAMLDASDLGHYIGDGHMPLHLATNYDGKLTGQSGVHARYETTMVGAYQTALSAYKGDTVLHHITNLNKYVFDYIYFDQHYKDSVLIADKYATTLASSTTSSQYMAALWSKTQFTIMLFQNSSHTLAELIYSAWIDAGSPSFASKIKTAISSVYGSNVSVYPNPSKGTFQLAGDDIFRTEVSSLAGTVIGSYYDKHIDLRSFSNGMYILSIYGKEGLLKKKKIMIIK